MVGARRARATLEEAEVKQKYPGLVYNPVTLLGVGLALFGLAAIVILGVLSKLSGGSNPYLGIFIFLIFPGVLVLGLALIPVGVYREKRRRQHGQTRPLVIDLGDPHHRNVAVTVLIGSCVFLLVTSIGLYEGYHYTESVEFCGDVCHVVMEPERVAHANSPHAKVACVRCHIGPGAGWYVQSKLSGARQVFKTILDIYPRPIPTPIENLRPAQDVCEQCHWPQKFYPASEVVRDHYLADEANTHWQVRMLIKVGGAAGGSGDRPTGIHWHVHPENRITYVATDSSRQAFDRVTWLHEGREVVYTRGGKPLAEEALAEARRHGRQRRMDCIDCHNRPSHIYLAPMTAANEALAQGRLDAGLPFIKREVVKALSARYATVEGTRDSLALALASFYQELGAGPADGAIETARALFARSSFPRMKARWDVYPDNRSHFIFPGCFRCHGSDLATADGRTISRDCDLCHAVLAQGPADAIGDTLVASGATFRHPVDIGGAETETPCFECHRGDDSLY